MTSPSTRSAPDRPPCPAHTRWDGLEDIWARLTATGRVEIEPHYTVPGYWSVHTPGHTDKLATSHIVDLCGVGVVVVNHETGQPWCS